MASKKRSDITVFITRRESTCGECDTDLGRKAWITLLPDKGALCLSCADMDHLLFLPAGDAALTRRARKYSTLCAVVLRWSPARKRYERQGLLVEPDALGQAEQECLADSEARARRREREAARRAALDRQYVHDFAQQIRAKYPSCPPGREEIIAEHACLKYSGRIGRSAAAKQLDDEAIKTAVIAHVRHAETSYDSLLARGYDRWDARSLVADEVNQVLAAWSGEQD